MQRVHQSHLLTGMPSFSLGFELLGAAGSAGAVKEMKPAVS